MENNNSNQKFKKTLTGTVVSTKSEKTIIVLVERRFKHAKYSKFITKSKKFHAHDEKGIAKEGEIVTIMESRPFSKLKRWVLV